MSVSTQSRRGYRQHRASGHRRNQPDTPELIEFRALTERLKLDMATELHRSEAARREAAKTLAWSIALSLLQGIGVVLLLASEHHALARVLQFLGVNEPYRERTGWGFDAMLAQVGWQPLAALTLGALVGLGFHFDVLEFEPTENTEPPSVS